MIIREKQDFIKKITNFYNEKTQVLLKKKLYQEKKIVFFLYFLTRKNSLFLSHFSQFLR